MAAKQIWINGENGINTWMCFVKDIELEEAPRRLDAKIAADSKYWLWINGAQAVFEGGVKRGPYRNGTYCDSLDIAGYLKTGRNRIAVLVWYFGDDGFSHVSSGQGGLIFDAESIGAVSDGSWKIRKHPAYVKADKGDEPSNFRLAESNVYFDAARDIGAWYMPGYDVSGWDCADCAENSAWGKLKAYQMYSTDCQRKYRA